MASDEVIPKIPIPSPLFAAGIMSATTVAEDEVEDSECRSMGKADEKHTCHGRGQEI